MQTVEKAGLSSKEKRLLLTAAFLGIFYLAFQFGFTPLYNEYKEKSEEYDRLIEEQARVQATLATAAIVREAHENAAADYKKIEADYLLVGADTDLSRMLTNLCRDNGLESLGLSFADPAALRLPGSGEMEPAFYTVSASMNVSGSYADIRRLLDVVYEDNNVRITRLSLSPREDVTWAERFPLSFVVTLLR